MEQAVPKTLFGGARFRLMRPIPSSQSTAAPGKVDTECGAVFPGLAKRRMEPDDIDKQTRRGQWVWGRGRVRLCNLAILTTE